MSENKPSQNRNILLRGFGELHANIKDYLADDITVKVWADKGKFAKRTNAPLTHDINTFYRKLQMQKKTGALSINYQYRKEFRHIYKELMKHSSAFMYIYARKPIFNGENNIMDMMDAFHIYIHFFIDLLKVNNINCVFLKVPHHADYILYLVAKALRIKTVLFLQSMEPGKSFIATSIEQLGSINNDTEDAQPITIKRNERKKYSYMENLTKPNPYRKLISALLFRNNMDLLFHRLMNLRRERKFKRDYKNLSTDNLSPGKFVYFPLHLQPELTTQSLGGIFVDQMLAIEYLRDLLPDEWKIVVKENPKQTAYARGSLFFARLEKIPNAIYVGNTFNTYDLLEKCEFCATITGTAGFEALTFGKRVLIFGQAMYRDLPGVIQYRDNLTFEDVTSAHFSHTEFELAYAKLVHGMVDLVVDTDYIQLVKDFSMEKNTQALADIINLYARE